MISSGLTQTDSDEDEGAEGAGSLARGGDSKSGSWEGKKSGRSVKKCRSCGVACRGEKFFAPTMKPKSFLIILI